MRACYLTDLKRVEVAKADIPQVGSDEVLIKVKAAGICGSDFHAFVGSHPFRKPPMILGHEAAGEIVRIGGKVKTLQVGDRVTVEPVKTCERCSFCIGGQYNLCQDKVMAGVRGWLGTFAEYFVIKERRAHKLPESLDYDMGVLAEPLAVAVHAVKLAGVQKGMSCAVLGAGTIGLLAGVAARYAGAGKVFCTDLNGFRLGIASRLGLSPLKADEVSVEEYIRAEVPDGPDVILLALSAPAVLGQAVRLVKRGGTIVVIGVFSQPVPVEINILQVNEIVLRGSNIYIGEDFQMSLDILCKYRNELQTMITHHANFEEVGGLLDSLTDPRNKAVKIIVHPG